MRVQLRYSPILVIACVALWLSAAPSASAGRGDGASGRQGNALDGENVTQAVPGLHVRFEDDRIQKLVQDAQPGSKTLRDLFARLESSDLVAYVRCDPRLRPHAMGLITWVSKVADIRYVLIRVAYVGSRMPQVAVVGHELRHAIEVAEHPAIVDVESFYDVYKRIGWVNRAASALGGIAYETDAARAAGDQILKELQKATE